MRKIKYLPKWFQLTWYQNFIYRLFFKTFDQIFVERLDILLLFKKHVDEYLDETLKHQTKSPGIIPKNPQCVQPSKGD